MPQTTTNGFTNGHKKDNLEMEDGQTFLFSSESVGEGHPGKFILLFQYMLKIDFSSTSHFASRQYHRSLIPCFPVPVCYLPRAQNGVIHGSWIFFLQIFRFLAIDHVSSESVFINFHLFISQNRFIFLIHFIPTTKFLWLCAKVSRMNAQKNFHVFVTPRFPFLERLVFLVGFVLVFATKNHMLSRRL